MKRPALNIGLCTLCMGCVEVCPRVFEFNENAGYIQVADLDTYRSSWWTRPSNIARKTALSGKKNNRQKFPENPVALH